jgi:putative chitinase
MKAHEFINESNLNIDDLEEGWKDWVAGAAIGAGVLGGAAHLAKTPEPIQKPAVTGKITQEVPNAMAKIVKLPAAKALISTAKSSGIAGEELAQFIAQCAHETNDFASLKEYGGKLDFKKYELKHNPRLAKILGNVKPGDGAKYHGRGYIQLTGRDNYRRAGEALDLPLEQRPDLVERPDVAAKVAVWYWKSRVQPKVSDFSDTSQVTRPINAGLRGLEDRHSKFTDVIALMKKAPRT